MNKASAVEKRFFPWTHQRFVEALVRALARLHWQNYQNSGSFVSAHTSHEVLLGDARCKLELKLTASWREIGEGIEVVVSVSEDENSWSVVECKKQCKLVLDLLHEPMCGRQTHNNIALAR